MENEYFVSGVVTTKQRGSFAIICSQYYDGNVMDVYGNDEDEARTSAESIVESLNTIAEANAEIERLRAALAQTWQPINNSKVQCTEFPTGGASQHGDYLVAWSDELNEGTVHLPDDVRLCRKVTP